MEALRRSVEASRQQKHTPGNRHQAGGLETSERASRSEGQGAFGGKKGRKGGRRDAPSGVADRADLDAMSKSELYELAKDRDVPGRSEMTKGELVDALAGEKRRKAS